VIIVSSLLIERDEGFFQGLQVSPHEEEYESQDEHGREQHKGARIEVLNGLHQASDLATLPCHLVDAVDRNNSRMIDPWAWKYRLWVLELPASVVGKIRRFFPAVFKFEIPFGTTFVRNLKLRINLFSGTFA